MKNKKIPKLLRDKLSKAGKKGWLIKLKKAKEKENKKVEGK